MRIATSWGLKAGLLVVLTPLAAVLANGLSAWQRLWAFARLNAALGGRVDPSVVVLGVPELHGSGRITLGRRLYLYRELYLETQGRGEIALGDDVVMSRGVHVVAFGRIEIGEGTMIGEYTSLRDANHCFGAGVLIRESGHEIHPIRIGRNVWIGRGVTVLPGVEIGDGAVVAANAVVTRSVLPGATVGGVPARPIQRHLQRATAEETL